jgi:hypothetical protein
MFVACMLLTGRPRPAAAWQQRPARFSVRRAPLRAWGYFSITERRVTGSGDTIGATSAAKGRVAAAAWGIAMPFFASFTNKEWERKKARKPEKQKE